MGSSIYPVPLSGIQETLVDAKGDLIVGSAADATARLAVGTNDHVLTADSSATNGIKWAAASGGGAFTSIASGSLSSTSVSITGIVGTYTNLMLFVRDWYPSSQDHYLAIRFNNNSSGTNYGWTLVRSQATSTGANQFAANEFHFNDGANGQNNSDGNNFAKFTIFDYTNTSTHKFAEFGGSFLAGTTPTQTQRVINGGLVWKATPAAITEINIIMIGGSSFSAGTYELYGVK